MSWLKAPSLLARLCRRHQGSDNCKPADTGILTPVLHAARHARELSVAFGCFQRCRRSFTSTDAKPWMLFTLHPTKPISMLAYDGGNKISM
jgi:hypothetical protein